MPHPVDLAARTYYWKPSMAWFRALELDVYRSEGIRLPPPTLDLGSGDGRVARMLEDLGVLEGPVHGIELSRRFLDEARSVGAHASLVQADAGRLPFDDGAFASILTNGVLCSIAEGPASALAEIRRVLEPGGMVVATIPTNRFTETLFWTRLLGFWPRARETYARRADRRQQHVTTDSVADWCDRFEGAGLEIDRARPFLSELGGGLWNLAAMHVFRVAGLLKLLTAAGPLASRLLSLGIGPLYRREARREGSGYLLVVARKPLDRSEA